ncbi:MAG: sirohydrochlorin cobaltochelatase [Chitinivibrionales bacterium]
MCNNTASDKETSGVSGGNEAILIACFGSTVDRARESFKEFDSLLKEKYKEKEIRWAYTSSIIRKKLNKKGEDIKGVYQSLEELKRDGFDRITIQSLHTIPGKEFHDMVRDYNRFKDVLDESNKNITVNIGYPMISRYEDLERAAKGMVEGAPADRRDDEALVFMGHGSEHSAGLIYMALAYELENKYNSVFLGTVEGHPDLDNVIDKCKKGGFKTVWLVPFMSIAGDHAVNDLAGEGKDSWKSVFSRNGFKCKIHLEGTLQNSYTRQVWLDHLEKALRN